MDYEVSYCGQQPNYISFAPSCCDSNGNCNSRLCHALLRQTTPKGWKWDKENKRLIAYVEKLKDKGNLMPALGLEVYVENAQAWIEKRMDELMRFNFCRRIWEESEEKPKGE